MRIAMGWRLLAAGVGAYVLALIALAPATLADIGLRGSSDGRIRIAEARGTLWSGSGQLEIHAADGRTGLGRHLAWRLQPGALLHARIAYEVQLDSELRPIGVTISPAQIEIAHADFSLPAAALGFGAPRFAQLAPTGDVQLQVASLAFGHHEVRGIATLQWRNAGSALSPVSPLGDYELRIEGDGLAVRTTLHTLKGPLQLDGQGTSANGRDPVFLATAQMPPELWPQLAPFLRLFAVERDDGSFEFEAR